MQGKLKSAARAAASSRFRTGRRSGYAAAMMHEPLRFGPDLIQQSQEARREAEEAREQAKALALRLGQPWPKTPDVSATILQPPPQRAEH